MHYEINVSHNGQHLFATAERSLLTEAKAKALFQDFATRFPAEQGYSVRCTAPKRPTTYPQVVHRDKI